MLWEIAADGVDVREIRERLDLDSGYLSRLLRSLEREGLVTVGSSPADSRVRTARPTDDGRAREPISIGAATSSPRRCSLRSAPASGSDWSTRWTR